MRLALGSDHAGFVLKEALKASLAAAGHEILDLGTHDTAAADYPDFATAVGQAVTARRADRGLLVCGSGVGMAIAANKVAGVRAANCDDVLVARLARAHNDANVLALGARVVGPGLAEAIVEAFLETAFEGGRHSGRVQKIHALERG